MDPFHYFAGDRLSAAELSAAALDGDLLPLGDAYILADTAETVWMRARSLTEVLGTNLAATHATAAWIYGALSELPTKLDVQRSSELRRHHTPNRRFTYRDLQLPPEDATHIGGISVATEVRTLTDLARGGAEYAHALQALLALRPELVEPALRWLDDHTGLPRVKVARQRLEALASTQS